MFYTYFLESDKDTRYRNSYNLFKIKIFFRNERSLAKSLTKCIIKATCICIHSLFMNRTHLQVKANIKIQKF